MPSLATDTVTLTLDRGTLFATPDAGHLRVLHGTDVTFTADFPFSVEFTALTDSPPLATGTASACGGPGPGYSFVLSAPPIPPTGLAPSYKYTIRGAGAAAGKVLDPIIIVDKK